MVDDVRGAVQDAVRLGAIGFDAVKHRRSNVEIGALLADAFPAGAHTIQDEVESTLDELARLAAVEFV